MAIETDDSRLGRMEGRVEEQAAAIQDINRRIDAVNQRMDQGFQAFNQRMDRLFLATWAIGGGIIAALVIQIVRAG